MKVDSRHPSGGHIHLTGTELNSHSGCCSTPYRFFREDGGLFDLKSMDVTSFGGSDAADLEGSNGAMRPIRTWVRHPPPPPGRNQGPALEPGLFLSGMIPETGLLRVYV